MIVEREADAFFAKRVEDRHDARRLVELAALRHLEHDAREIDAGARRRSFHHARQLGAERERIDVDEDRCSRGECRRRLERTRDRGEIQLAKTSQPRGVLEQFGGTAGRPVAADARQRFEGHDLDGAVAHLDDRLKRGLQKVAGEDLIERRDADDLVVAVVAGWVGVEDRFEIGDRERLRQHRHRAVLDRGGAQRVARLSGDQRDAALRPLRVDAVEEVQPFVAELPGELHVGDDVRDRRAREHELRRFGIRTDDRRAPFALEQQRQRGGDALVVVGDEDRLAAHAIISR